ncbi:NADH dehydrogenase (ubiquinone) complex I, assembly factor 6 [Lingula anatina]|uniref:NADH dehydrogenase (ubiquinone) complex I, assembly factor 6 n=1 Tax=Lingula anatina TaxID=7574 RepID=A0A2R2MP92_LINAN|nr:NADH dehydrogenase (ubiquinone) complex I, assembly factor 6 [Lingula anatina]|eukprot:XP_023931837.1 NADH dehydrogenase (ubiquinone) complex I, assembly factor 6 [Lingula anatina]
MAAPLKSFADRTTAVILSNCVKKRFSLPGSSYSKRSSGTYSSNSDENYCVDLVRKHDYENFLCTLLLPESYRSAAFAIRAFNVEIAQVRDVVTDKKVGQMRMQFWKDSIERVFQGNPPESPICLQLARELETKKFSKAWFKRIIEKRDAQLSDQGFKSIAELEEYAENTVSSIQYLLLQAAGVEDIHADHAASHIGKAVGIVTALRSVPYHSGRGRVYIPYELLMKHNVSETSIARGSQEQPVRDAMFDIASQAQSHLKKARTLQPNIPKEAYVTFLSTVSCNSYLQQLQEFDFDVFHSKLQRRKHFLPLSLWWHKSRKKY